MSGLVSSVPSQVTGPRLENEAMTSLTSLAPTPKDSGKLPGEPTVPADGPSLPLENTGTMPAATQACTSGRYSGWLGAEAPHELLTTSGRAAGSPPGASIHWNAAWMPLVEAPPPSLKILAAIQVAPGATPTTSPGGPPTMVPATCVPCPKPSPGVAYSSPVATNQLLAGSPDAPRQLSVRAGC